MRNRKIFWLAWPRTGSTWASQVLAKIIGAPCHDANWQKSHKMVVHSHYRAPEYKEQVYGGPFKRIVGIRDPRDAIVSHYYMACHSNPAFSPENLSILQYIQWYFLGERDDISMPHCSFMQWYQEWLDEGADVWVRHEDLLADQRGEFLGIVEMLGEEVVGDVDAIIERWQSFKQYEYNDDYAHGVITQQSRTPGISTWKRFLGQPELALIYETAGELMHHFGYEW